MMTPNKKEFLRIVKAYLAGTATPQQIAVVEEYFDLFSTEPEYLDELQKSDVHVIRNRLKSKIAASIDSQAKPGFVLSWKYIPTAAALLLSFAFGYYFYDSRPQIAKMSVVKSRPRANITPGGNKAILTLADGQRVSLTDAKAGQIADQSGVIVQKTNDGQLLYGKNNSSGHVYNRIETPRGGQYQVTLSDGTKVWLNAASSLSYPVSFSRDDRKVELSGEGYFEVSPNKHKPFKVITGRQVVEVLGTHFNINAYQDEQVTKTSLLEGSVRITNSKTMVTSMLSPGEQSALGANKDEIAIKRVDVDEAVAWKNGYFMFDNEPLPSILRKVARWYDVEVSYQGIPESSKITFSGTLSRYATVSKALQKLELTGAVHFRIEGKSIIVTP